MHPISSLVVDDEELARTLLENYIGRLPGLELVAKCKDPVEALQVLQSQAVELMFLDIQMPGLTGIELLKSLQKKPLVILTTAYSEYALEGYSLDVVDYLLKPFSFERFLQAVNRATELLNLKNAALSVAPAEKPYIMVKSEHRIHRVYFEQINYIQSMREYVAFYTSSGRILSLNSLKRLEASLPADQFMRIHKSYIVAIPKIDALEGNLLHIGREKLPIGASYREAVLERFLK